MKKKSNSNTSYMVEDTIKKTPDNRASYIRSTLGRESAPFDRSSPRTKKRDLVKFSQAGDLSSIKGS